MDHPTSDAREWRDDAPVVSRPPGMLGGAPTSDRPARPLPRAAAPSAWSTALAWRRSAHASTGGDRGPHSPDRDRDLSLHVPRVLLFTTLATCLSIAAAAGVTFVTLEAAARRDATRALHFVEARLATIEADMRQLAAQAARDPMWSSCQPSLAALLARASIASDLVQWYEVSMDGYDGSCRPEGRAVAPLYEHAAGARLSLTSTREILARPTATLRVDGNGHVIAAVLDPRAFRPQPADPASPSYESALPLWLLSENGEPLTELQTTPSGSTSLPLRRLQLRSRVQPVSVTTTLERDAYAHALRAFMPTVLLLTWLLMAACVAFAWRRAIFRARLYHRIAHGLRRREFEPFVQPIMNLQTGRCAGVEVLMRWAHPQRGMLGPAEFIEEAERTGLIVGMTDLIMTRAAHRLARVAAQHPTLYFSFNLTPQQLALPHLPTRLAEIFRPDTIPRDRVLLEVTEREFVDPLALGSVRALHEAGWRVAIDDFGTGHSSLASLEQLPIDRLKIDRAFVASISDATVNRPVLDAIIQLADRLRIPAIAEGIETQAQWDYLVARGVRCGQGFLMGRPMPIGAFTEWLADDVAASRPAHASLLRSSDAQIMPDPAAQQLWNAMRTPGGLDIRDRMYRLRTYPQCFVGREAVDWMVQHYRVSRDDAVRMGQRLSALGLLSHVLQEHDFEDAELFYELATPRGASLVTGPSANGLRAALRAARPSIVQEHSRGVLRHRECATGAAIVSWIARARQVSRETATHWALQLMREGGLRHVYDDAPFRDDRTLYRIV